MVGRWSAFLQQHWQALLISIGALVLATVAAGWIESTLRSMGESSEAETTATTDRPSTDSLILPVTGTRLGVTLDETEDGLVVGEVVPGSPANDAGIETGDRLVAIAGEEIATRDEAVDALAAVEDEEFEVEIEREGEARTVQVQRDAEPSAGRVDPAQVIPSGPMLGITVEETEEGIRVVGVAPSSGADEAGLEVGAIIVEADGNPVATGEELRAAVIAHEAGETMELVLQEGTEQRAVSVEVTEGAPMASVPSFGLEMPEWLDGFDFDPSSLGDLSEEDLRELRDALAAAIDEGGQRFEEWADDLLRQLDELIEEATNRDSGPETATPAA